MDLKTAIKPDRPNGSLVYQERERESSRDSATYYSRVKTEMDILETTCECRWAIRCKNQYLSVSLLDCFHGRFISIEPCPQRLAMFRENRNQVLMVETSPSISLDRLMGASAEPLRAVLQLLGAEKTKCKSAQWQCDKQENIGK